MKVHEFRQPAESRLDDETEALAELVIGACIEVHRILGPGLPELVCKKALCHELILRNVLHQPECPVPVYYKGVLVGEGKLDLLVAGKLIIELKVVEHLTDVHRAQCIAYLSAMGLQLALLVNFNVAVLKDGLKRVIRSQSSLRD